MPSPESHAKARNARLVLAQELRGLLQAPALWAMLVLISLLTGYSFIQAVDLFSQASHTALSYPELAAGMDPFQGIFVPAFGAYYLSETLLLPFVAIRLIALDKRSGALKLLLQLPLSSLSLCALKLAAMGLIWLLALVPALAVLLVWHHLGGDLYAPSLLLLFAGHALYALLIVAIAMFAAAIADSPPTAAMLCLAVTLGSWVLDFAAAGHGHGWMRRLSALSLTAMLRQLESGLFSSVHAASLLILAGLFFGLAAIWMHPGRRLSRKLAQSAGTTAAAVGLFMGNLAFPEYADLTENRIHSFAPATARALRQLDRTLTITVHLASGDSRLLDFENDVLGKLRRTVPRLNVRYASGNRQETGLFQAETGDKYGLIEYDYNGRHAQSYSNSPEEILPLLYGLAGIRPPAAGTASPARGHPLVANADASRWLFYLVFPLLAVLAGATCVSARLSRIFGNSSPRAGSDSEV